MLASFSTNCETCLDFISSIEDVIINSVARKMSNSSYPLDAFYDLGMLSSSGCLLFISTCLSLTAYNRFNSIICFVPTFISLDVSMHFMNVAFTVAFSLINHILDQRQAAESNYH